MLYIAYAVLWLLRFALGACVFSFLGVVVWRLPRRESVVKGRSHCPVCGRTLSAAELIPCLSYLLQGGKCRGCGAKIPARDFWIEVLGGLCSCACAYAFGGETAQAALAFVVRTFIFEPVRVDGSSMLNTLEDSEFMIATKFDYLMGDPERFDIVICDYPNTDDGMYRVKRVIGLPGETIELRKGELYVNGEHIEQQFDMTPNETDFGPFTVPEGKYFVMGDNRNNSKDSRSPMVGALERKMIKGHVRCVVFPLNKARILGE